MSKNVIILGGPKHETRMAVPESAWYGLSMAEAPDFFPSWQDDDRSCAVPDFRTVSYRFFDLRLSPKRKITAALHPDLHEETGRMLLGDLVYASWEKHGVVSRG